MKKNEKILSFELSTTKDSLDIHFDESGLDNFINLLIKLKKTEQTHEHLITKDWGGSELTNIPQSEYSILLNKVTLHKW